MALLILSLKPFERIGLACKLALGLIGAWVIAALVALGLQCDHPDRWNLGPDHCVDQYALIVALAVIHMVLDVAMICLPVVLLWQIQIIQQRRYHISALFAMRIL